MELYGQKHLEKESCKKVTVLSAYAIIYVEFT